MTLSSDWLTHLDKWLYQDGKYILMKFSYFHPRLPVSIKNILEAEVIQACR